MSCMDEKRVLGTGGGGSEIRSTVFLQMMACLDRRRLSVLRLAGRGFRGSYPVSKTATEDSRILRKQCLPPPNLCPAEAKNNIRMTWTHLIIMNRYRVLHTSCCHTWTRRRKHHTIYFPHYNHHSKTMSSSLSTSSSSSWISAFV